MSQRTEDIRADADWLSLDYLISECIWVQVEVYS